MVKDLIRNILAKLGIKKTKKEIEGIANNVQNKIENKEDEKETEEKIKQDLLIEALNKGNLKEFKKIANSMENLNFTTDRGYLIEDLCNSKMEKDKIKPYIKALLDTKT